MPKPTKPFSPSAATARPAGRGRVAKASLFLSLLLAAAPLSVCSVRPPEERPATALAGRLFQLVEGTFLPVGAAGSGQPGRGFEPAPFQPWTIQSRVSDLASLADSVYLAVNGYGIAALAPADKNLQQLPASSFVYFYDSQIFRYRTLTSLVAEGETLLCHLYFNTLLNVANDNDLKLQGISLVRLRPRTGDYQFLVPPYQKTHPGWEAVGFLPDSPQVFSFQWKYSDRNRTLFSYSRWDLSSTEEREIEELDFRRSYGFRDVEQQGPAALKALFKEARRQLDWPGFSTAYQLKVREQDAPLLQRYEYHPEGFSQAERIRLVTLSLFHRGRMYLLLLPDGLVLQAEEDNRQIRHFRLASLPEGFIYCDLLLHGEHLLASWEQLSFIEVGAAGIFLEKFPFFP